MLAEKLVGNNFHNNFAFDLLRSILIIRSRSNQFDSFGMNRSLNFWESNAKCFRRRVSLAAQSFGLPK